MKLPKIFIAVACALPLVGCGTLMDKSERSHYVDLIEFETNKEFDGNQKKLMECMVAIAADPYLKFKVTMLMQRHRILSMVDMDSLEEKNEQQIKAMSVKAARTMVEHPRFKAYMADYDRYIFSDPRVKRSGACQITFS